MAVGEISVKSVVFHPHYFQPYVSLQIFLPFTKEARTREGLNNGDGKPLTSLITPTELV